MGKKCDIIDDLNVQGKSKRLIQMNDTVKSSLAVVDDLLFKIKQMG